MFERVIYDDNGVPWQEVIIMDAREVSVMGVQYLTGKECNPFGLEARAPRDYTNRHRDGDGMVWKMIPLASVVRRTEMAFFGNRLRSVDYQTKAGA